MSKKEPGALFGASCGKEEKRTESCFIEHLDSFFFQRGSVFFLVVCTFSASPLGATISTGQNMRVCFESFCLISLFHLKIYSFSISFSF
jgi:hypothetical protein